MCVSLGPDALANHGHSGTFGIEKALKMIEAGSSGGGK